MKHEIRPQTISAFSFLSYSLIKSFRVFVDSFSNYYLAVNSCVSVDVISKSSWQHEISLFMTDFLLSKTKGIFQFYNGVVILTETETDKMGTEPNESLCRYLSLCSVNISTQFFPSYCLIGICFSLGVSQCKQITKRQYASVRKGVLEPFLQHYTCLQPDTLCRKSLLSQY